MFFFEHVLMRLEKSKYRDNIILKGGVLLSSIIGKSLPIPCIFENFKPFKSTILSPINNKNIQTAPIVNGQEQIVFQRCHRRFVLHGLRKTLHF